MEPETYAMAKVVALRMEVRDLEAELERVRARVMELEAPLPDDAIVQANHEQLVHNYCRLAKQYQDDKMQVRALKAERDALRAALAFAASAIKSGEPWTARCEEVIGQSLAGVEGEECGQPDDRTEGHG